MSLGLRLCIIEMPPSNMEYPESVGKGWLTADQVRSSAESYRGNSYGTYLMSLINENA